MSDESVTIVITRLVRAGSEAAFERAVREWIPKSIEHVGHQGALLIHPHAGGREYGAVLRFHSLQRWQDFQAAPAYRLFLAEIQPLLEEDPRVVTATGLEAWFRDAGMAPPPRWKMAVVTWIGVCVVVGLLGAVLGPMMSDWSWFARLLAMNAAVVAALTWLVMPPLVAVAGPWLRRRGHAS